MSPFPDSRLAHEDVAPATLRPYKFEVVAVVQRVDADGNVTGEAPSEMVTVFGCDGLAEWAAEFPSKLEEATG